MLKKHNKIEKSPFYQYDETDFSLFPRGGDGRGGLSG